MQRHRLRIFGTAHAEPAGEPDMRKQFTRAFVGWLSAASFAACAAAPLERPIEMGPVDTGPASLEAVRRQFQGTWDLVSLDTFPKPGGTAVPVTGATAVLTYDEYGNLNMKGTASSPILDYSGRALIDVAKQELHLQAVSGSGGADDLPKEVDFAAVRKYAFDGALLKMSTIDAQGNITATAVWKRRTP
jgi:hypothetical protein